MSLTAVIVQARMGSSRLPGKVLLPLAGQTVLWHVLTRCQAIPGIDLVACATTQAAADIAIVREAERAGARVYRGSQADVLGRYQQAARSLGADVIMRVTGDCPLIDPDVCGKVLALRAETGADYACNNMPRSWPYGLDCEAFTANALFQAANTAKTSNEREHVTPWIRNN